MMSDNYLQRVLKNAQKSYQQLAQGTALNTENRSVATMNAVKSYILAKGLKTGDPLPTEATFCEALNVSRSSVREALRKLEALDIVTVYQGRGSFVGEMSMQPLVETLVLRTALQHSSGDKSLSEVVKIRRALDVGISREIVAAMKGTENPEIWQIVDTMTKKAKNGESYLQEDIDFHSAMLRHLDNDLLQQLMSAMWLINQTIIPKMDAEKSNHKKKKLEETADAHRMMLEAAEAGDWERYLKALEQHYAPIRQLIEENQTSQPQED